MYDLASLSVALVFPMVSIHTNKRYRKLKGQSRMNSPKTLSTLGTIDTGQRQKHKNITQCGKLKRSQKLGFTSIHELNTILNI